MEIDLIKNGFVDHVQINSYLIRTPKKCQLTSLSSLSSSLLDAVGMMAGDWPSGKELKIVRCFD